MPKGRWAQKVHSSAITFKSHYDTDSVINLPSSGESFSSTCLLPVSRSHQLAFFRWVVLINLPSSGESFSSTCLLPVSRSLSLFCDVDIDVFLPWLKLFLFVGREHIALLFNLNFVVVWYFLNLVIILLLSFVLFVWELDAILTIWWTINFVIWTSGRSIRIQKERIKL